MTAIRHKPRQRTKSAEKKRKDDTRKKRERALPRLVLLQTFCEVVSHGGVTAAAKKLHMTQGAVSARIAELEQALNLNEPLIDRDPTTRRHHFRLTATGQRLYPEATRLLDSWQRTLRELGTPAPPPTLRIGAIESVLHSWLIDWLAVVQRDSPTATLELTIETTDELLRLLRRGMLDVVFAAKEGEGDAGRHRALHAMPMAFVGSRKHHTRSHYSLQQITAEGYGLVTFQRGSIPYVRILEQIRAKGLGRRRVHSVSSISAMQRLVASGFGVATLPRGLSELTGATASLRSLNCDEALAPLPIHASWSPEQGSDLIDRIVDSATACAADWAKRAELG